MEKKKPNFFKQISKIRRYILSFLWPETCAGGICMREYRWVTEILCIAHKKWSVMFPKWRIKIGESLRDAALREFREETGIYKCTIGDKIGVVRDRKRGKNITFYFITDPGSMTHLKDEHALWIPIKTVLNSLRHKPEQKFLKKYFWKYI